eukprot:Nitzschia sp. Nitz4//scaffold10_size219509//98375//99232//NITZ4_001427-RA/size219509-processed-gene-0.130-mRNA-1//-1//CDS//3329532917//4226//frame0
MSTTTEIQSKDGTSLFVRQYNAVENPKAQILICHGYLEHCGRYQEFAEYLNTQNIAVTTFDFRGHGKSGGDRPVIRSFSEYDSDVEAMTSTLLKDVPAFLLGHSNGGLCVLQYALGRAHRSDTDVLKSTFRGVIVTNPYLAPAKPLPWIAKFVVRNLAPYFPSLKIPANLTGKDLTRDVAKQQDHDSDPLNLPSASLGWVAQALETQAKVMEWSQTVTFPLPLLFMHSDQDKVGCPKAMVDFITPLKGEDKQAILRKDEEHEILNEPDRASAYKIISDWAIQHAA